jgi:hypothetical protein
VTSLHRLTGGLLAILLLAACGGSGPLRPRTSPSPTTPSAYTVDATGQVACSNGTIGRRASGPVEFRAGLDGITARLTAVVGGNRWFRSLSHPELELTGTGMHWQVPVPAHPQAIHHRYYPMAIPFGHAESYLCLARFTPGQAPLALVSVYAGGAHCCTTTRFYDPTTRGRTDLDGMNFVPRLEILDGRPYVVHGDNDFAYAFASFADSCPPVQVFHPEAGALRDVTTDFPDVLGDDADRAWRYAQERRREPLGFYACWAADEVRLGHAADVWETLDRLAGQGRLDQRYAGRDDGAAFPRVLRRFLVDHGYPVD